MVGFDDQNDLKLVRIIINHFSSEIREVRGMAENGRVRGRMYFKTRLPDG